MDIAGVDVEIDVIKEYPELEDLVVDPSIEDQNFNSGKYGFKSVKINAIKGEELNLTPSTEEQVATGVFRTVKVNPIESQKLSATPTTEEQVITGLFDTVVVNPIETEELYTVPTTEEQVKKGLFNTVVVSPIQGETLNLAPTEEQQNFEGVFLGVNINPIQTEEITTDLDFSSSDSIELKAQEGSYIKKAIINKDTNLSPENIKKGISMLGVDGAFDAVDTRDATATSNDVVVGKTAYVNNEKLEGTIPDNGALEYVPLEEEQVIPTGYTSGGKITAVDITALQEYKDCLELSKQIVPSGYTQVEYITVKAGNGFDLGIPLWSDNYWIIEAEFSIDEIRDYQHIFSISDDDADHETWIASNGYYYERFANGVMKKIGSFVFKVDEKTNIEHKWRNGACTTYINDERRMYTSYGTFTSPLNLRFGKRGTSYFTGNIYSIKLRQGSNNTLVGDFIPVINNSNGEATLYNLVTKTFVTNLGINNNIAGPQV